MPFGRAGHLGDQSFHAPSSQVFWHYAAELHTLSVTYPLCGSALTDTTDNPPEMCPLKLTDFCLFLYQTVQASCWSVEGSKMRTFFFSASTRINASNIHFFLSPSLSLLFFLSALLATWKTVNGQRAEDKMQKRERNGDNTTFSTWKKIRHYNKLPLQAVSVPGVCPYYSCLNCPFPQNGFITNF